MTETRGNDLFLIFPRVGIMFRKMEGGVSVMTNDTTSHFALPTIVRPLNPTKAGDAFAGTVMGYLACDESGAASIDFIVGEEQNDL